MSISIPADQGLETAMSFFLLNPFVVLFVVGVTTAVSILIAILYLIKRWGDA